MRTIDQNKLFRWPVFENPRKIFKNALNFSPPNGGDFAHGNQTKHVFPSFLQLFITADEKYHFDCLNSEPGSTWVGMFTTWVEMFRSWVNLGWDVYNLG